jgi:hypothetical protein
MTYCGFPMQGCLPLNVFNSIRIGSTMCTKLAQVLQNPSFLIFHLCEGLMSMAVTQRVEKSCPFRLMIGFWHGWVDQNPVKKTLPKIHFASFNHVNSVDIR